MNPYAELVHSQKIPTKQDIILAYKHNFNRRVINYLIVNSNLSDDEMLKLMCEVEDTKRIEKLLIKGANPNFESDSILFKSIPVFRLLLKYGRKEDFGEILWRSVYTHNVDMFKFALSYDPKIKFSVEDMLDEESYGTIKALHFVQPIKNLPHNVFLFCEGYISEDLIDSDDDVLMEVIERQNSKKNILRTPKDMRFTFC